jgi:hypothetical protein
MNNGDFLTTTEARFKFEKAVCENLKHVDLVGKSRRSPPPEEIAHILDVFAMISIERPYSLHSRSFQIHKIEVPKHKFYVFTGFSPLDVDLEAPEVDTY